jgi:hypothetical protein
MKRSLLVFLDFVSNTSMTVSLNSVPVPSSLEKTMEGLKAGRNFNTSSSKTRIFDSAINVAVCAKIE